jgi:4-hydroxythreonine-4-phosphate dehydrogenase
MENRKIRVAITQGDTNGIGYELIFKAFAGTEILDLCTPIIYGSPKIATYHDNALDLNAKFTIINDASEARDGRVNLLTVFDDDVKVELGTPTEESGNAGLRAIDRALADYQQGLFDVLVTAPIDNNDAFHFSGQSRYIEDHIECDGQGLSILTSDDLRVALVTRNLPLHQVAESITKENIEATAKKFYESLRRDFRISNPRIAVLSINPKAGDNGLLGTEEQEIIRPAIEELAKEDIEAFGPYATDRLFGTGDYDYFDGILAMYYDQGLAPFRAIAPDSGVNYTAGLPIVRTAPEVGASFDIAGRNEADATPMLHAIYLAIDIFRHRKEYDEAGTNPLPKLYHEKKDDSDKVRYAIPKKREDRIPHRHDYKAPENS